MKLMISDLRNLVDTNLPGIKLTHPEILLSEYISGI